MPVIFQKFIYRSDLQDNPDVLYIFGDNLVRKGRGGQAKEMRDEPNAVGIATKNTPGHGERRHYFSDNSFEEQKKVIDKDLEIVYKTLEEGGIVVWPSDGIGTGLSDLDKYSPDTARYIDDVLADLITMKGE